MEARIPPVTDMNERFVSTKYHMPIVTAEKNRMNVIASNKVRMSLMRFFFIVNLLWLQWCLSYLMFPRSTHFSRSISYSLSRSSVSIGLGGSIGSPSAICECSSNCLDSSCWNVPWPSFFCSCRRRRWSDLGSFSVELLVG